MKNSIRSMAGATALALTVSLPQPAHADRGGHITPPDVPAKIRPEEGSRLFLVGHAFPPP